MSTLTTFEPILSFLKHQVVDTQLQYTLSKKFPLSGDTVQHIRSWCVEAVNDGSVKMRGPNSLRFGNVLHQKRNDYGFRIDIVDMTGVGPGHVHPLGEINLCFSIERSDTGMTSFDGISEGWVVKQPGSWHKPTVRNGRMIIVYFLPKGKVVFD